MKNNLKLSIPLAILITLIAVIYQRSTGPTYPKKFEIGLKEKITIKFPRSHGGVTDAPIEIPVIEPGMKATLTYKRYPMEEAWKTMDFVRAGNVLKANLPNQPPAGKLVYYMNINYGEGKDIQELGTKENPIYIRYKGEVPTSILAPHVVCMFLSMLLSVVALFEALFKTNLFVTLGRITLGCLFVGGMILGPLVQKYAFGVYWAGFPYDWDLTDNKLLIGVLAWVFAVSMTIRVKRRWPVILAAITLFVVYSIPHSMQGSEYDYKKGKVITDMD